MPSPEFVSPGVFGLSPTFFFSGLRSFCSSLQVSRYLCRFLRTLQRLLRHAWLSLSHQFSGLSFPSADFTPLCSLSSAFPHSSLACALLPAFLSLRPVCLLSLPADIMRSIRFSFLFRGALCRLRLKLPEDMEEYGLIIPGAQTEQTDYLSA